MSNTFERSLAAVAQAHALCEQGLYLQAQDLLPALEALKDTQAQLARARILAHLGDQRRADAVLLRAWRRDRANPRALVDMLRGMEKRGPYRTWLLLRRWPLPAAAAGPVRAEYLSLRGHQWALLRDFEQSERDHREALALDPDDPWLKVEHAYSLELADRYGDALAQAEAALALRPGYRIAVHKLSDLYALLGRDDEALALLARAAQAQQSGSLCAAWHDLAIEKGRLDDAATALEGCARYWPLADKPTLAWLAARRADLALLRLDKPEAIAQSRLVPGPYYERLAQRLETTDAPQRRVVLPVGFVRQHHLTCAPATLTALCRYWGLPADHLGIAEEICYDGTAHHSERRWAEEQGLWVREFTVNWEVAKALLDAGVPFTVTSVATLSAHLQAVIGYDEWRGSLLIRDPFKRTANEFDAEAFFKSHSAHGPRGMVLLPQDQAHRAAGIELPDAFLWNGYHRVMRALGAHDRDAAQLSAQALSRIDPSHRLTLNAQRALAMYDRNDSALLAITERLLALDAYEPNLSVHKAALLGVLGGRAQCEAWWDEVMRESGFDPATAVRYVQFLMENGRLAESCRGWLHKVLSVTPTDGAAWHALGGVHWLCGRQQEALDCYRIASCLQYTNEHYAESYVSGSRVTRRGEEGLDHLRRRAAQLGSRAAAPWITLFVQLDLVERTAEGFDQLARALAQRPDDPDLLLFAAEAELRRGQRAAGHAHLDKARHVAKQATWLRSQALFLRDEGRWAQAVEVSRQAAALEPLNVETHRMVANGLGNTQGRDAAVAYLRQVASRHPQHFELQRLLLAHLPQDPVAPLVEQLDHMLDINPVDAWTHREKAFKLGQARRLDEALAHAGTALELAPHSSQSHAAMAYVRWRQGDLDAARQHFKDALAISVDNEYALASLVELETTREGRMAALQFIQQALLRQVTTGDGLLAFQEQARMAMDADELLSVLQAAHRQRPDLWHAWAALSIQFNRMGRLDESLGLQDEALRRFPLMARLYAERGRTLLLKQRRDEARENFKQALQLSPAWAWPVRLFVDSVADEGHQLERAEPVLEAALRRQPAHADLRALRGWLHWRLGRLPQALDDLRAAVSLDPGPRWAWEVLQRVAQEGQQPQAAAQAAQAVAEVRPGDVIAWLRLSEFAATPERAMQAAEHGCALEPRHEAMVEQRLDLLLKARRGDEVLAYLKANPWGEAAPAQIIAFEARVHHQRGEMGHAVAVMRRVLENHPEQAGLWRELADWFDQLGRAPEYLQAAQRLLGLAPQSALAHAYVGHALQQQGQLQEAEQSLARALAIEPSYRFAALQLVDLTMGQERWHDAEAHLDTLERYDQTPLVALRRAQCAAATRQRRLAIDKALQVVATPQVHPQLSQAAVDCVNRAGWSVYFAEAIEDALKKGPCSRAAVRLWLDHQGGGWLPGAFYRDVRKALRQDPSGAVKQGLLLWLADHKDARLLNRFVKDYRQTLRQDTECWALAAGAYIDQERPAEAVAWMQDWRDRADAPAWALDNLATAYRQIGRHRDAFTVTSRSLSIHPDNPEAWLWQAFDAGRAGDLAALAGHLERLKDVELRPYFSHLRQALSAYSDAAQAGQSGLALTRFASLKILSHKHRHAVLQRLLRQFSRELVARHTPSWKKPYRWLQFRLGWS